MIDLLHESLLQIATYLTLAISLSSFWISTDKRIPLALFFISLVIGLISGGISYLALVSIIAFGALIYLFYQKNFSTSIKTLLFFSIVILTVLTFLHKVPGYDNWQAVKEIKLSKNSADLEMWFNFDKPLIAFFLLLFAYKPVSRIVQYKEIFNRSFLFLVPLIMALSIFGTAIGYVVFDPKIPSFTLILLWMVKMLFFTVIAEEFFFRFFLQNNLTAIFKKVKHAEIWGLILASLIFGLFHFSGGLAFVFLAFVSGLLYGGVYLRTKYIESAILLHFLVNLTHFFFFSYPHYSKIAS
jgi:membrane protease YdiL (CAAX protease family)